MKKTLKLLLIFMGSFIVILVGGIGGYNLIMSNQTFYIYDLRFVKPVENARGYIYTNGGENYKTMQTMQVYLQSDQENYLEVAVFVSTSNGNTKIKIDSSDESVAKINFINNRCYVKYLQAGKATITTSLGPVSDSFDIEVFDKIPSNFRVYDFSYYGTNYATRPAYINNLVCYSDEAEALSYEYDYELYDEEGKLDEGNFNSALLEIDKKSLTNSYFDEIILDTNNKKLKLVCKQQALKQSIHTSIAINSYFMVNGEKCLDDSFNIDIYIIANEIEFVQIEVSTNPDFTNNCVCLNIPNVDYSDNLTNEDLISYLTCQRVEENLSISGENAVYNIFITDKTPEIYMKFRLVYTNGTIKDLNMSNMGEVYDLTVDGNKFNSEESYLYLSDDKNNYLEAEPLGEYFVLKLNSEYMTSLENATTIFEFGLLGDLLDINLNSNAQKHLRTFNISYLDLNKISDAKKLYSLNDDGTYSFDYWDNRTISQNVVYDDNGKVIAFLGE